MYICYTKKFSLPFYFFMTQIKKKFKNGFKYNSVVPHRKPRWFTRRNRAAVPNLFRIITLKTDLLLPLAAKKRVHQA
jgi:hypothetical protein